MEINNQIRDFVHKEIDENLIPNLKKFIEIPNVSRAYDENWDTNGLQQKAVKFCYDWALEQSIKGLDLKIIEREGLTPLLLGTVAPSKEENKKNIFMYGHIDKQPPLTENWSEGLHPYKPVIRDGKLYGRGAGDDGYAFFMSVLLVKAYQTLGIEHPRVVLFFETDEESGSKDLMYYVDEFKDVIGKPDIILCLDSGALSYDSINITTSLRGMCSFTFRVSVLSEGVHSGDASGVTPSVFRIARQLLERVESVKTGEVVSDFHVNIPSDKYTQAEKVIKIVGKGKESEFPFLEGVKTTEEDAFRNYLNRTWKPQLTVIGVSGLPECKVAGNVCHPYVDFKISLRLPPTLDGQTAINMLKDIIVKDPPYNAKVEILSPIFGNGWNCNTYSDKFLKNLNELSLKEFGKEAMLIGEGGSIPFVGEFQKKFNDAVFMVTGILGPKTNAHGPDEFLPIEFLKHVATVIGQLIVTENQ